MSKEQEKALDYDHFALEYFAPLYPFVAGKAVGRSGIRSGRLLDIGCAGGHLGLAVMEKGDFHGTFCDINTESLKLAEKRLQERNLKGRTVACDVQDMPFEEESFDLIVSRGSMPFWKDQKKAFEEIWRVLSPDGRAYIGVGYGSAELREQIREKMKKKDGVKAGPRGRGKETMMYPENEPYEKILEDLGAYYRIYDNDDEGRWFLFGKKALPDDPS